MTGEFITKSGYLKLKSELDFLKKKKRVEVAERIKEALSIGDIAENAEYAEAKEEQAFVEGRVAEIENILRTASLIALTPRKKTSVYIGCAIEVKSDETLRKFFVVGKGEGDPGKGQISSDSPIGQALLGKRIGDEIEVPTPLGMKKYKVIRIS
ncbi:MAG: transcription elongation factor GreA [Candidatus Spechtbacteria bacterium]|nr:transcription elongation factor GreA [Candidatus Spechtbacteria bacterium]